MANNIIYRFAPLLGWLFPVVEPFVPRVISSELRSRLKKLKQQGIISDYKTRTKRLGQFHYKFTIDLDLTQEQIAYLTKDMVDQLQRSIGGDVEEVIVWLRKGRVMSRLLST